MNSSTLFTLEAEKIQSPEQHPLPRLIGHLDLKGVQLAPDFLFEYLEFFSQCGYKALLVEYEDIFPYASVNFAMIPEEVWSRDFLNAFLEKAASLGLEIIPLQQSLGHLEYAFRWSEYREFSISQGYLSTLNVSLPAAKEWLKNLLNEMIQAHPHSRWIHLGMDEAYSLLQEAERVREHPLALFLNYLEELCEVCEAAGKQPVIWADMLEKYIVPEYIERIRSLKDRVVLISWNYHGPWRDQPNRHPSVRFSGLRASTQWCQDARQPDAPEGVNDIFSSFDDWPPEIAALVEPYKIGDKWVKAFFPAAIWREMGFRVLGGCGVATAADGNVLPLYHRRMANVDAWAEACRDYKLDGLVVTVWARGDSFRAPHVLPIAIYPLLEYAAGKIAPLSPVVAPTIPRDRLWNILWKIGRCQDDWYVQKNIFADIAELRQRLETKDMFWDSLSALFRIWEANYRLGNCIAQCEKRFFANRIVASEWDMHISRLDQCGDHLRDLQGDCEALLDVYCGHALGEWTTIAFDQPIERWQHVRQLAIEKRRSAVRVFEGTRNKAYALEASPV